MSQNKGHKFRAWDKRTRIMRDLGSHIQDMIEFQYFSAEAMEFDLIFMQYTGLEDKNGVEIYEGDIVKIQYVSYPLEVHYNTVLASFQLGKEHRFTALQDIEVIGNIYENPELLEGKDVTE